MRGWGKIMMKSDLQPPRTGLNADPILYGVAAGLAEIFPPIDSSDPRPSRLRKDASDGPDAARKPRNEE
jgi:hypothetical protein